jgi:hypothetical protein
VINDSNKESLNIKRVVLYDVPKHLEGRAYGETRFIFVRYLFYSQECVWAWQQF